MLKTKFLFTFNIPLLVDKTIQCIENDVIYMISIIKWRFELFNFIINIY